MDCTSAPSINRYYGLEYINTYGVTNINNLAASCNANKDLFNAFLNYSKTQNSTYPNALQDFVINTSIPANAKTEVASLINGPNNKVNQNLTEIAFYIKREEFDSIVNGTFESSNILSFMRDLANAIITNVCINPQHTYASTHVNDLRKVALLFDNFPYLCFEYMQIKLKNDSAKYRPDPTQTPNATSSSYRNHPKMSNSCALEQ